MFLKKIVSLLLFVSLSVGILPAADDHNLTDTQLHAFLGIVTNFILSDGIVYHGLRYKVVTSPYTGHKWLDRNLGATQVCTSFDDVACYGDYYQWGRNYDGHQHSTSGTTNILATDINAAGNKFITNSNSPHDWASVDNDGLLRSANWSKTDGTSVCPTGYKVPTLSELRAELLDVDSAEIQNRNDAFNSFLKFPSAGGHHSNDADMFNVGLWGYVWTSGNHPRNISFGSNSASSSGSYRAHGFSVRCLKD